LLQTNDESIIASIKSLAKKKKNFLGGVDGGTEAGIEEELKILKTAIQHLGMIS
jgi:hypothetical protein